MSIAAAPEAPLLALRGVSRRFGGTVALAEVDFDLRAGEIHALLGENGAGKSTLIKVLGGIHSPDAGAVLLDGASVTIRGAAAAQRLGIRIIHQELSLFPNLTVAENLYAGREPARGGWLLRGEMAAGARALIRELGLEELRDVDARVGSLSVAHQQLVEIARALSLRARILVLDEPTSSLSGAETHALFITLRRLREQGVGIIYITHRMEEIFQLADRITVLRDGRSVMTRRADVVDRRELVRWMVGREVTERYPRPARGSGSAALEARGLCSAALHDVSFSLARGEVLGVAGLVGAGRTELARALFGVDRLAAGEVRVDGAPVRLRGPMDALRAGMALVPEDRKREGLITIQSVGFNLALPWLREWARGCAPDERRRRGIVDRAIEAFGIRASSPEQPVDRLSGGNQQKVVVGKWMERRPAVLLLDEPTRGVDVGAREEMFRIIGQLVETGMAVLLISSDLSEVMALSHRVVVFRAGRILRIVDAESVTAEEIMADLTGA